MDWQCPLCGEPLKLVDKQWCCENKHVFDRAKEGYVNLQPVQFKKSKVPGDSKEMVNARRDFLSRGYYEPLALKLSSTLETLNTHSSIMLHDLGCGEGYYLATIAEQLSNAGFSVSASGNDIAKVAIQKAAKKYKSHSFCVASSFQLPVADETMSSIVQVFAPANPAEVNRVLMEGGLWLSVEPGPSHLKQLKQAIYDTPDENHPRPVSHPQLLIEDTISLSFDMQLKNNDDRLSLLMMTPYFWKVQDEQRDQVLDRMDILTADFVITIYRKCATALV